MSIKITISGGSIQGGFSVSGNLYIKCNECGNQRKVPGRNNGIESCPSCGSNKFTLESGATPPDWFVEDDMGAA